MTRGQVAVLVVGGGPAGAATALLLARRGWDVELVERTRPPRGKACGECLNPAGVRLLQAMGLSLPGGRRGELAGWELVLPGGPAAVGRFAPGDRGAGIERASFDAMLLDAARAAGVRVLEGRRVVRVRAGGAAGPAAVLLDGPGGAWRTARFLVGADGLHSRVRASLGLGGAARPPFKASLTWRVEGHGPARDRGRLVLGPGLTAGLAPVGGADRGRWNATLVATRGAPSAPPPERLASEGWATYLALLAGGDLAGRSGWDAAPRVVDGPWSSGSFHRPVRRPAHGRTLLVGDAAGYFDPLTGQGIFRALLGARLAAEALDGHLCREGPRASDARRLDPADVGAGAAYARRLRRALGPGRGLQRVIEAVVSRERPRRAAVRALARLPRLASALVRCTGDRPRTALDPRDSRLSPPPRARC